MGLGHNQQQNPTVHSGGVRRVPCRSPAPPLPLTFRSPSAHHLLPFCFLWTFLWTIFVDNSFGHFLWTLFVDTFCRHILWTLFVDTFLDTFWENILWTHSVEHPLKKRRKKKEKKVFPFLYVLVSVLLSAYVERFSVPCMQDFYEKNTDTRTNNLHHGKVVSVVVSMSLRLMVQYFQQQKMQ